MEEKGRMIEWILLLVFLNFLLTLFAVSKILEIEEKLKSREKSE